MEFKINIDDTFTLTQITPEILKDHNIKLGENVSIEESVIMDNNVMIGDNVSIKGNTTIGISVQIGHYSIVNNSELHNNVKIGHHCIIENSLIEKGSELDNNITTKSKIEGKLKFNKTLENGVFIKEGKLNIYYTGNDKITINCVTYKLKDVINNFEAIAKKNKFSVDKANKAMKYLKLIKEIGK